MNSILKSIFSFSCILLSCIGSATQAQSAESLIEVISQVSYLESSSVTPPPENANWRDMDLPLGSRTGDRDQSNRVIWMKFSLNSPATSDLSALYFYRHNLSVDVFFNGNRVGGDTYKEGYQTVSWNRPRLVPIQPANWNSDENFVHIRFATSYYGGTFAPILFGPADALQTSFETRFFRQVTVNQWMQYAGILAFILSTTLWFFRRSDKSYLMFAGMTACWIVLASHMVIYYNFIDYRYWLPLVHISTDVWGLLFFHFVSNLMNINRPRTSLAVKVWAASAVIWNLVAPLEVWWVGAYVMHAVGNLLILYLMLCVVRIAIVERNRLAMAICLTICAQIGFFTHDFLLVLLASPEDWEGAFYYSQFAFPLLMLVFAGALLHRFVSALAEAEQLNSELEERVEASKKLIEKSLAEKHELELKQAAAKERLQIYRDLHDDVGSKLLSIVHAEKSDTSNSQFGDLARLALQSLRNAVSRANSPEQSIDNFFTELAEEAQLRLQGSGHQVVWNRSGQLPDLILSSSHVFSINQIIREVINNIIRHAQATSVTFSIAIDSKFLEFTISDNGKGIDTTTTHGNGLNNIKSRIAELSGSVSWGNTEGGGSTVVFQVPLETQAQQNVSPEVI